MKRNEMLYSSNFLKEIPRHYKNNFTVKRT